jgi:hypothetical protein
LKAKSTIEVEKLTAEKGSIQFIGLGGVNKVKTSSQQIEIEFRDRIARENQQKDEKLTAIADGFEANSHQFDMVKRELEQKIVGSQSEYEQNRTSSVTNSEAKIKQMTESHLTRMTAISQDHANVREQIATNGNAFQRRVRGNCAQHQSSIDEYNRMMESDAQKRGREWIELRRFFDDKFAVLTKKKDVAMQEFQQRPPRQSDIDIIGQLEGLLQIKTTQLQNAIKDLQEYRALRQKQEKETAHRFGKPPKVGVLPLTVKITH